MPFAESREARGFVLGKALIRIGIASGHQVRYRAVEALGLLGVFGVLEGFLRKPQAGDPVERLGDDAVISAAARAIARRKDENTFVLLCELAMRHPLKGVITALVEATGISLKEKAFKRGNCWRANGDDIGDTVGILMQRCDLRERCEQVRWVVTGIRQSRTPGFQSGVIGWLRLNRYLSAAAGF
jgi:hypothetical protein